jgi:MYXO-CTERM domain-containing protein
MHQCQPPSYGGYYGAPAVGLNGSAANVPTGTSSGSGVTGGASVDKGSSTPTTPPSAAGPTGTPNGNTGSAGASNGAESSSKGNGSASSDSGGCQVGAGQADTTGASFLALLGVAGLVRRNRKRTRWG